MEIKNYRKNTDPSRTYKATFDIYIEKWNLVIRNIRLFTSKNGHDFVSMPSFKGSDDKFTPYVEFTGETKKRFETKILDELKTVVESPELRESEDIPF